MTTTLKEHVFTALRRLLTPIIKILLRNGVSHKDFCVLSKDIFIEVATADFGLRGRPTNVSRISLLTGIDRKEVKRIRSLLQHNSHIDNSRLTQDKCSRLLSAWYLDSEFLNDSGLPDILPLEGNSASFMALVKRYGGDIPPQTFLKEMIRANVIEALPSGHAKILQRNFMPAYSDPDAILRAGSVIGELTDTLFHNLYESRNDGKKIARFERRASNNHVDPKHQKLFKAFLDKEGQAFLERVDTWLSAHEVTTTVSTDTSNNTSPNQPVLRLGVGVYAIHKSQDNKED